MSRSKQCSNLFERKLFCSLLMVLLSFVLLSAFWNQAYFASDEEEIFVKGEQIAQGLLLYQDIGCQHMPLMYFTAAFFHVLGVHTITGFRLCFYFLMALIWGLMFYCYSDYFGKGVMAIYPLIYIGAIAGMSYGTCVLSEQFQGQGMVILLLELLIFSDTYKLKLRNCSMISLAILISFGNAFVSIFSIFFVALTVFSLEIRQCCLQKKRMGKKFLECLGQYGRLLVIVVLPFAVMLIYFKATHTLHSFYSWAYVLNREVYPKYTEGYGGGIFGGLFGGISNLGASAEISGVLTSQNARALAMVVISILYLLALYRDKKDKILSTGITFLLIGSSTRGAFNSFHGLPACAVMSAMAAIYIWNLIPKLPKTQKQLVINILCLTIFFSGYVSAFGALFSVTTKRIAEPTSEAYNQRKLEECLDAITEDGERVGFSLLNYDILMNANVTPASVVGGSCPWLWEWGGAQAMLELTANPPRIFLFDRGYATWGYPIKDYAENLIKFIEDNYISLEEYGQSVLYVRNDIYADIMPIIDEDLVYKIYNQNLAGFSLENGIEISQTFRARSDCDITSLSIMVGTFLRNNNCIIQVYIQDEKEGERIALGELNCNGLTDMAYAEVTITPYKLQKDHLYTMVIVSPDSDSGNFVSLYHDTFGASDTTYASINGERQEYNWAVKIEKTINLREGEET